MPNDIFKHKYNDSNLLLELNLKYFYKLSDMSFGIIQFLLNARGMYALAPCRLDLLHFITPTW